jgi:hypothetical protein
MADTERDALDDSDVEITDLDRPAGPLLPRRFFLTPGQRRWSVALTCVLFVLVIGGLLASTADVRALLARTVFQPAPPIPANDLPFYVQGNPSWGSFTLDGKLIAHPPLPERDYPMLLTPGLHTLIWQAAPFKPRTCLFRVLDASTVSGPCFLSKEVSAGFVPNVSGMLFSFFASANDLPTDQQATLIQQLQAVMATYGSSELVRPGEFYAVSQQQIVADPTLCTVLARAVICDARASQPLQATLSVQLDSSTSHDDPCAVSEQCLINNQDCRELCNDPFLPYNNTPIQGWSVAIAVSLSWSYTTLSGQVVARAQPASALRGAATYQIVPVHLTRAGQGWHISPFPDNYGVAADNPLCNQAAGDTNELVSSSSGNQEMFVQQVADMQGRGTAGCLVVLQTSPGTALNPSTPVPGMGSPQVAYCLVRFGVVLAVNHLARQSWPFLPVVDDYENNLAQTLLATLPPST